MSDTAAQTSHSKSMTIGEGGTALALTALAFVALIVAAKAYTPEYAFHAYLFTAASAAAVIAIVNRYYERPAALAPLTIDGRPNYNTGPVKFATIRQCSGALRYVIVAQDAKRPARAQAQRKVCAGDSAGASHDANAAGRHMNVLLYLVPMALALGLTGLAAFLWSLCAGQ